MAETPETTTEAEDAAIALAGTAGAKNGGDAGGETAGRPRLLSPEEVRLIGETVGGHTHWQADLARTLKCSKSQITRYLNGSRDTNTLLAADLQELVLKQIASLAALLSIEGLPGSDTMSVFKAQQLIEEGLDLARVAADPRR
ncbi:hypothetical protein BAJUN_00040 [Bajunvirus bajun]|uniref:Uncharacterized protein n=1 Tax=Brevundimonas phage vB_BgoS-Bajun TaxID=2948594 RepID=A0A9E7N4I2_9CAUD|nr:hypothetical protein BAJUN_00040 [Brevundimonas phage vB_BgoS-Bajun]